MMATTTQGILAGLSRGGRAFMRTIRPGVLVLMYHRIAVETHDPARLCVSPANFEAHLRTLRGKGVRIVRLAELADALQRGSPPRRTAAITFDDGYADNLVRAKPLLERYDAPATVFVTTDHIGASREFWWDTLALICFEAPSLPEELILDTGSEERRWRPCGRAEPATASRGGGERLVSRAELYAELSELLLNRHPKEREKLIDRLREWAALPSEGRAERRTMTASELRQLAADGLVEIGAHSRSHPPLTRLPPQDRAQEIEGSKRALEDVLKREVASWSYPHGDHSPETRHALRVAGFRIGCTTRQTLARRGTDPLEIPRVAVEDWPADRFERLLHDYLRV
jgi:peptidoglycan/xylan/chitin deacetylase (PgdA/CDA1 family)